jgi:predicted CopG family antitoxin
MITTIQIREAVKAQLDKIKQSERQTYEEVIISLIKAVELQRRKQEELLIEGCKEMATENLRICKEWETTDATLDWECDGLIPKKYLKKEK